ncbi:heme biosynthesis HemY N-terminal domain-containing protein [Shewanella intestini]|uniref:Heme biosynthesis protein HemY n=1 Tax=Shewanella intestini TaxID=2017544 RepID=A0ABS5I6E6_9GAMM|nr:MULTISPECIES: heme biosynthesis HemY N-terminal domain-containing protein [Shewanella]MBR9729601.1 heme biosynthesis protein HemY [Shewanella intestini]MRG37671.1 heme biosynthesis protein HemY [Shewanella sp. XMDDZSB0408]
MIKTLAYVIIILVGLCISPLFVGSLGHVYIAAGEYQIETSLVFAIFGLIIFYSLLQLLEWIIVFTLNLLINSRYLPEQWRKKAAKKHTLTGALALAEEDWPAAEKAMLKGAGKGEIPALNLFAAARAAQHQNKIEQRDEYLAKVAKDPLAHVAAKTSRTRYLLQQGDFNNARETLDTLNPTSKSKAPVLILAQDLYLQQQDWQALKLLLPILKKRKLIEAKELEALTLKTNTSLLFTAMKDSEAELEKCWHWLSNAEKKVPEALTIYAMGLCRYQRKADAIKILNKAIKAGISNALLQSLPEIVNADDDSIRKQLMAHEASQKDNALFHECLAKLAQQTRDIKQAKHHWQTVCEISPTKDAWLALAQIHEQLGDNANAIYCYRKAAKT